MVMKSSKGIAELQVMVSTSSLSKDKEPEWFWALSAAEQRRYQHASYAQLGDRRIVGDGVRFIADRTIGMCNKGQRIGVILGL